MDTQSLWRASEWRVHTLLRRARHTQHGRSVETRDLQLTSTAGYTLAARITRRVGAGAQPGLVVSRSPSGTTLQVHITAMSFGSWSRNNFTLPTLVKLP